MTYEANIHLQLEENCVVSRMKLRLERNFYNSIRSNFISNPAKTAKVVSFAMSGFRSLYRLSI